MEGLFGPTSANAASGNTGLTIAVSKYGELVSLKWPLPNYYDQLNYKGLYPIPSGWQVEDYNRFHNAQPRHGSFAGIEYKQNGVKKTSWFRDSTWTQTQYYLSATSPIIITEYTNSQLQLTVTSTDFVLHNQDAFLRKYSIHWNNVNLIQNAKIVFIANMAPCNKNPDFEPNQDWVADQNNGFGNAYYSPKGAFVSFIPNSTVANNSLLPFFLSPQATIDNFVEDIDSLFPSQTTSYNPGELLITKDIHCVIGANRMPIAHGMDSDYGFAQTMPDSLIPNSQSISAGAAMLYNLYDLNLSNPNHSDSIVFQFAFGPQYQLAQTLYDSVFAANYNTLLSNTKNYWETKLSTAVIPQTGDAAMQKTLKRILVNTLIGINRGSGGIGSSVCSSQPAYSELWVRDAAVMGYMLDCAGYTEEATNQALFFSDIQRENFGDDCRIPANNECYAGTWFQCYYADGRPSWMYDFEIDEAGWGVWMLHQHSNFLSGIEKTDYLNAVYPAIKRGADFLRDFEDTLTGLQSAATEDDVLWHSQTIYGAATTLMGLKAAVSAGILMNESLSELDSWNNRIAELENAIEVHKWGLQGNQYDYTVYGNFGARAIAIWPALLKDTLNSQLLSHADSLNSQILPFFTKADNSLNYEWWYLGKTLTSLAYLWRSNPAKRPVIENYLSTVLKEVPTTGTLSYGETVMVRDMDSSGVMVRKYDNRVGQPSNHPAAWFYMTAQMLYGNSLPDLYVGVEDKNSSEENKILIYPNPSQGSFTINNSTNDSGFLEIYSATGSLILNSTLAKGVNRIEMQKKSAGIYFAVMRVEEKMLTKKIIVN